MVLVAQVQVYVETYEEQGMFGKGPRNREKTSF